MSAAKTALAAELGYFERHRSLWLKEHPNQYAVIQGNTLLGFFDSFAAAYYDGVRAFGAHAEFLVKRVVENEPVYVVF